MIYIITNSFNPTVGKVIDWLKYYNIDFKRINNFILESSNILIHKTLSHTKQTDFYWIYKANFKCEKIVDQIVLNQLYFEHIQSFFKTIDSSMKLGQVLDITDRSKFNILQDAMKIGLDVPKSLITNSKNSLQKFNTENPILITKSSHDMFNFKLGNSLYRPYTTIIKESDIKKLNNYFGVSLFQEYIKKQCDIKALYIDGKFYSQAIFTNSNNIDFRFSYNDENQISVPFRLPKYTEKYTRKLLKKYSLNFAIVDFILDYKDNIIFLEINPDGVFDYLSYSCNYNIENKIALYLYEKSNCK